MKKSVTIVCLVAVAVVCARGAESAEEVFAALRARADTRIAEIRAVPNRAVPEAAPKRFLSEKGGNDAADGTTSQTAWKTIARLYREKLVPGTYVLFARGGLYRRMGGRWVRFNPRGIAVNDVRSWQRLSLAVLENPWLFTLPGYSSEEGVHLGRNVVLERGTRIKPPVIMQDNTWCSRNVWLDGDVIVGQGSFIGEGAHLRRTLVGDNTYVGMGLDLSDKIVVGHRVIDAETGHWTDVDEPGVAQYIGGVGWLKRLWRFVLGTSYGRSR